MVSRAASAAVLADAADEADPAAADADPDAAEADPDAALALDAALLAEVEAAAADADAAFALEAADWALASAVAGVDCTTSAGVVTTIAVATWRSRLRTSLLPRADDSVPTRPKYGLPAMLILASQVERLVTQQHGCKRIGIGSSLGVIGLGLGKAHKCL